MQQMDIVFLRQSCVENVIHSIVETYIHNETQYIVDKEGKVIGQATRGECHSNPKLIHQVAHCWIFNKKGQVLWQQRSLKKDGAAGWWDMSVGGHVPAGERPEETLQREMKEELDLEKVKASFVEKYIRGNNKQTELISLYYAVVDKPASEFKFDEEETQQLKWVSPWEAQFDLLNNKVESTDFIITQVSRIYQTVFEQYMRASK